MKRKIVHFAFTILIFSLLIYAQETNTEEINEQKALQAINDSSRVINEMKENNFSVNYMEDKLTEAKRIFEQAKYAEILRGNVNATEKEKIEAKEVLRLVKWENINYSNVLDYTEDIKKRKEVALLLFDKISIEENKINSLTETNKDLFKDIELAFSEERYNDAEKLLEEYKNAVEKEKAKNSFLSGIQKNTRNFFQKFWAYILISLTFLVIISYLTYKIFRKKLLLNKVKRIKTEEHVLNSLIKRTQEERFNENKISGLVYNIRMKKYKERLQEIKEELPVFERELTKSNNMKK